MSAFCTTCAAPLGEGQRFCTICGTPADGSAGPPPPAYTPPAATTGCTTCGGEGAHLPLREVFCSGCRWLRPLTQGHRIPTDAFLWSFDAQAMTTLQRMGPLTTAADALSRRVGRPWLEASVNGLRLAPDQIPDIFAAAVDVARTLGLSRLPELYISGEQMWDCMTLGSDQQQFIVIGSILTNLQGADLRFVLGREMGRVLAGHALWKTVLQFISGKGASRTIMGHGALQMLNPVKLIESAIDAPLMAWSRHAEITADRAGLLAVGDRDAARRVLIQTALKSFPIYARLNMATLERDLASSDDRQSTLSEWTMSSTPYLARRLRLLDEYAASETLTGWRAVIDYHLAAEAQAARPPEDPGLVRLACVACGTGLRVRRSDLEGKDVAKVRCTNTACGKVLEISPRPPDQAQVHRIVTPPTGLRVTCPACQGPLIAPADALDGRDAVNIRCPDKACGKVLTLRAPAKAPAPSAPLTPPPAVTPAARPEEMAE